MIFKNSRHMHLIIFSLTATFMNPSILFAQSDWQSKVPLNNRAMDKKVISQVRLSTKDAFELVFPSVESILQNVVFDREKNLKTILQLIEQNVFKSKTLIKLPSQLTEYYRLHQRIYTNNETVVNLPELDGINPETFEQSPWHINRILSQNYTLAFNPKGADQGLDSLIELMTLKKRILIDLSKIELELKQATHSNRNIMRLLIVPSIRATINQSTPVGAMIEFMNSIRCENGDTACSYLKSGIGSVLHYTISKKEQEIKSILSRFNLFMNESHLTSASIIKTLFAFNEWYLSIGIQSPKNWEVELNKRLKNILNTKANANFAEQYHSIALHLLILNELKLTRDQIQNYSAYKDELSIEQKTKAFQAIDPKWIQSINEMNQQIKILSFLEEDFTL